MKARRGTPKGSRGRSTSRRDEQASNQPFHRWVGETLVLEIRVQPRASRDEIVGAAGGRLRVRVTAPPVDDAANERLVRLLAAELGVAASRVRVVAGAASREKRVAIEGPSRRPSWLED